MTLLKYVDPTFFLLQSAPHAWHFRSLFFILFYPFVIVFLVYHERFCVSSILLPYILYITP